MSRKPFFAVIVAVALCGAPSVLPAQKPAAQVVTCGWTSLDTAALPSTIAQLIARGAPEVDGDATAELGKWYRQCESGAGREAVRLLRARLQRNSSAVTKALLGVALLRGPDVQVEGVEGVALRPIRPRSNGEREGVRLLRDVLEKNNWPEVALELAAVQSWTLNKKEALASAQLLERRAPMLNSAEAWTALGQLEISLGRYTEAERAGQQAVALGDGGGDRVVGIGRFLSANRRVQEGWKAYSAGLTDSTTTLLAYYDDVRLLLSPAELAEWPTLSTGRAEWIRQRWEWRAQLAGTTTAERVAEHHRRVRAALERYPRMTYAGAPLTLQLWRDPYTTSLPLDDRGLIYVRLGEPARVLRMRPRRGALPQRIAWVYNNIGLSPTVYEFDVSPDRPGYFLTEPIVGIPCTTAGDSKPTEIHEAMPPVGDLGDWSHSLFNYNRLMAAYYNDCAWYHYLPLRGEVRATAELARRIENAVPAFVDPLKATSNLYAFRGTDARVELVNYLFLETRGLGGDVRQDRAHYALNVLLSVATVAEAPIIRRDTVIEFSLPPAVVQDARVGIPIGITAPSATDSRVSLTAQNAGNAEQGQVLVALRDLPSYTRGQLGISDIVIAETREGVWRRGGHNIAPIMGHALAEGTSYRLYLELYDVEPGVHEIALEVVPGRDESILARLKELMTSREAYTLRFEESLTPGPRGVTPIVKDIQADLKPGSYVIRVSVTNTTTRKTASAETALEILPGR